MATAKWNPAAISTLLSTELNSLANNYGAISSSAWDNTSNGYIRGWLELAVTFGSNPTAGYTVDVGVSVAMDGTNYSDYTSGASGYIPPTSLLGSYVLQAKTTIHRLVLGVNGGMPLEFGPFLHKFVVLNKSGVAFPASGSTLKFIPANYNIA